MTEQEISQMLDTLGAARRAEREREQVIRLCRERNADLPEWSSRMRHRCRVAAAVVMLAVPTAFAALLPQRDDAMLVACNIKGQDAAVIHCANQILNVS